MNSKKFVKKNLLYLPQFYRRFLLLILDIGLIFASIYPNINRLTVTLDGGLSPYKWLLISPAICIPILFLLGNYRSLTRYTGSISVYILSFRL